MENKILDKTTEIAEGSYDEAYKYLISQMKHINECSSQFYNYLYCISAAIGLKQDALKWLSEAIDVRGYWYRPEVFEDDDLDSIRKEGEFKRCKDESEKRYLVELDKARLLCTWERKKEKDIMLILHGNQQNIDICKENWNGVKIPGYQKEFLQSKTLDSYKLYRWNDEDKVQLPEILPTVSWNNYDAKILCGFSSGCNEILKSILSNKKICSGIILQSPWIPIINDKIEDVLNCLKGENIWVKIICGKEDEECKGLVSVFEEEANKKGINLEVKWIDNLRHSYPENFHEIVEEFFNK